MDKTVILTVRINPKIKEAIAAVAKDERRSTAAQVEKALEEWIAARQK